MLLHEYVFIIFVNPGKSHVVVGHLSYISLEEKMLILDDLSYSKFFRRHAHAGMHFLKDAYWLLANHAFLEVYTP